MKDKWLNTTFEDSTLQPFKEDMPDYNDPERIRECFPPPLPPTLTFITHRKDSLISVCVCAFFM